MKDGTFRVAFLLHTVKLCTKQQDFSLRPRSSKESDECILQRSLGAHSAQLTIH